MKWFETLEERRLRWARNARRTRLNNPEAQKKRMQRFKAKQEAEKVRLAGRPRPVNCDLCHEEGKTVWDHDHKTGLFRGWLCDRCNRVLGSVQDDPILLRKMIDYLGVKDETIVPAA